jgi:hypothetical protein
MDKKHVSLDAIVKTIKMWESESKNFRNDGWVQEGYREKLKKVFSASGSALSKK